MTTYSCTNGCRRPVIDAFVCSECAGELKAALSELPELAEELDTVLTRQSHYGSPYEAGRSAEIPLPFDGNASIMLSALRNTLTTWIRALATAKEALPADTITDLCAWLINRIERIRQHKAGAELLDEITSIARQCGWDIDRPQVAIYAGQCTDMDCQGEVYLRPGQPVGRCRDCGEPYKPRDVKELISTAEEQMARATDCARILSALGYPTRPGTVRNAAYKQRLLPRSVDPDGHPLYRIGDVLEALMSARSAP